MMSRLRKPSDQKVKEHSRPLIRWLNEKVIPQKDSLFEEDNPGDKDRNPQSSTHKLGLQEEILLVQINEHPFLHKTDRRKKLGWGTSRFNRIQEGLRNRGYLRLKKINKGGKGGICTLLELTGKGFDYLEAKDIPVNRYPGGVIHEFWVQKLVKFYKQKDLDVRREVKLQKVEVDLLAISREGKRLAVEVETSPPKDTLDKLDDLIPQVDKLIIASDKKVLLNRLRKQINHRKKVKLVKVQELDFG